MQVKEEKLKDSRVKLTIVLEPKELVLSYREAYDKVASDVNVQGFRPGKAPFAIIAEKIGHNKLLNEGIDTAVRNSYQKAGCLSAFLFYKLQLFSLGRMI